jgi:predicted TIM-barrel fold metal-dependent hydrolase
MNGAEWPGGVTMSCKDDNHEDKFLAMVSAKVDSDLRLSDYAPRTKLRVVAHVIEQPRFPVIDYHCHLDAQSPQAVMEIMDACGVEKIVNITMRTGQEAIDSIDRFHRATPDRFATIGWMDWSGIERSDFIQLSLDRLDRLVEHGACGIKFWKDLGLTVRDASGALLRVDDERLAPIFDKAAELNIPVVFHTADPDAFFDPVDGYNERYEELVAHPDWSFSGLPVTKASLLEQRDRVIARHPKTTFVGAHLAESSEDLGYVAKLLERNPNLYVDISARTAELGRQPYTAREFMVKFADRILFGTDLVPDVEMYRLHYRFLETADEYFEYPSHASRQGRWSIYGLFLPADVLEKVYRANALKLLPARV